MKIYCIKLKHLILFYSKKKHFYGNTNTADNTCSQLNKKMSYTFSSVTSVNNSGSLTCSDYTWPPEVSVAALASHKIKSN